MFYCQICLVVFHIQYKAVASFIFVSPPPVIEKRTLPPCKKKQGFEKKMNVMHDNPYEKHVKTQLFTVAWWDSPYLNTHLLLLPPALAEEVIFIGPVCVCVCLSIFALIPKPFDLRP